MLRRILDLLAVWPRAIVFPLEDARAILDTSDAEALRSDWQVVGDDIARAIEQARDAPPETDAG